MPREKRKYFKNASNKEKLSLAPFIVSEFINTNAFTQNVNKETFNIVKAAYYILDLHARNKNSKNNLSCAFNAVMTMINNFLFH